MKSLLTAFVALAVLLGRNTETFADSPDKPVKKDEVLKQLQATDQQLASPDEATRRAALKAIGKYYSEAGFSQTAIRVASVLEHDRSEDLRLQAADVLQGMGPAAASAVRVLAKALKDKSRKVRVKAAEALLQIGPCAKMAVPALLETLKDDDTFFRRKAVAALSMIGPPQDPDHAVSVLIKALKDKDDLKDRTQGMVPHVAAIALGNYGAAAAPAVPALIEATRSPDDGMRCVALIALARIRAQPRVVVPLLLRFLNDKDQAAIRSSVVGALGLMGPLAKEAAPTLFKAFDWNDINELQQEEIVRCTILKALVSIRADVKKVLPLLLKVFQDKDMASGVRRQAVMSIGELGPAAAEAVHVLIRCFNNEDRGYSLYTPQITYALVDIGAAAVGPLVKNLSATDLKILCRTIHALGKFGPTAAPAVGPLRELTQHSDRSVASEATWALREIERK